MTFLIFRYTSLLQTLYKERSPNVAHLSVGEGRFGPEKKPLKHDVPGPTSYDIEGSHKYANEFRGKVAFGATKRVSFCEAQARGNISPGPSKHVYSNKLLDKLSLSPLASSRKRL